MKLNTKLVAGFLATTAIAFGIAAYAAPGAGCDGMGPGMMMRDGMRPSGDQTARVEQHLARTKSQLKLTAEQEPLWQAFAEKAKASAQGMTATQNKAVEAKTAPERMAVMVDVMKARIGSMESVNAAFGKLYDALTPEQKAIADKQALLAGRMGQGRRGPPRTQDKAGTPG